MTQDEIIEMARQAGGMFSELPMIDAWVFGDKSLEAFAKLVAEHERKRIFDELIKMHEIASSRHNYYLNAVLTIKARGQE